MGKLSQAIIQIILRNLITDENFAQSLADSVTRIFDISPTNSKTDDPFENIVDQIQEYFGEDKIQVPGLRNNLIGMLKEKQFLAFARILRMLKDLFGYSDVRVINYIKQLKFSKTLTAESISPWIDVESTVEAIIEGLNPTKMKIFAKMSSKERYLLQGFNSEQIDVMSKFSPRGVVILSRLGHLPLNQRAMILSLKDDESKLFKDLGYSNIRLLSTDERNTILRLGAEDRKRFLQRYHIDEEKRQNFLSALANMEPREVNTLQNLIERERLVLQSLTEAAGNLAVDIKDLTSKEIDKYLYLSQKQINVLNNLNDDLVNVVLEFKNFNEVFYVANSLHSAQRDLILSLRQQEIDVLFGNGFEEDFHQVEELLRHSPEIIQNFNPLTSEEEDAILLLDEQQKTVLAKAYVIGLDGLGMMQDLGPHLTSQVLKGNKKLNVLQTALMKKLSNVNFNSDILNEKALSHLFKIMRHEAWAILGNLSWKGIKLLTRMADLNESMIETLRELSSQGMEVLIGNDKLTKMEIPMLRSLKVNEGRVLTNLSLNQRQFLLYKSDSTHLPSTLFNEEQRTVLRGMSHQGLSVLRRIITLSDNEERIFRGLKQVDRTVLTTIDSEALNLFAARNVDELEVFLSFTVWHLEEVMVFKLLDMGFGTSLNEGIAQIQTYLRSISTEVSIDDCHNHSSLIAATIEVLRLENVVTDAHIRILASMIEETTHQATHSLIFKLHLLKFSMRDSKSLESQLIPEIKGTKSELITISQIDRIRTIEDVMFIRWILSSPHTLNWSELFELGRGSLIQLSYQFSEGHELEVLLSKSTSQLDGIEHIQIAQGLKNMLKADQYLLASCFFFAIGRKSTSNEAEFKVTELLLETFDPYECFQFLNTLVQKEFFHRSQAHDYPNILSDGRFPDPNIFEVCLYYARGNVLALSKKLDQGQLWKLLEKRPLLSLRMMAGNFDIDLIELFREVVEVRQLMKANRTEIFESLMEELRNTSSLTPAMYQYIARGIRRLAYWDSFFGKENYITMISEYISFLRGRVSREVLRTCLNTFVSEDVSHEDLFSAMERWFGGELSISLKDHSHRSCQIMRKKRGLGMMCVDSMSTKDITSEEKQRIILSTFDDTQFKLYDELFQYSERKFHGAHVDLQVQQALISKMENVSPESLDPRIGDIVATIEDRQKFDQILKQSGILQRLEKVTSTTGLALTLFFVGKHLAHGEVEEVENLGYDVLNLWVMPKIGQQITNLLQEYHPVVGPVIGTTVSNFALYLGLVQGIIGRERAKNEVDKEIADLHIVTNIVLIATNIPEVATRIISNHGADISVIGELSVPIGMALTVSVIVASYIIDIGLEVKELGGHIRLSDSEKLSLYWRFFWDQPKPENLKIDVEAQNKYVEYISDHLHRLNGIYDKIAISLPSFLMTDEECVVNPGSRSKRQVESYCLGCTLGDKNTSYVMDFNEKAHAKDPFFTNRTISRLIPESLEGYDSVCGPSAKDAIEEILDQRLPPHTCHPDLIHDTKWNTQVKKLFIPSNLNDSCMNMVSFKKQEVSNSSRMFFYVAADASIELSNDDPLDIVFHGTDISIIDRGGTRINHNIHENTYHFKSQLKGCNVHKKGNNFFYVKGDRFQCNLGNKTEEQVNIVVVGSNFRDSSGIHSIVGSENRGTIKANFAEFVDGKGGGDTIRATQGTIVKGYFNDLIQGESTVMLPMNHSEIAELHANTLLSIYNREGSWIGVDENTRLMTADGYFLTPIRTSNVTDKVTRAHIKKTFDKRIIPQDELATLRMVKILNCKLVKQITSVKHDIVLSEVSQNIFVVDKNYHEFYWEGADDSSNLYIFRRMFANVTISKGNGLLDFQDLKMNPNFERPHLRWWIEGGFEIVIGSLHVNVLPKYKNIKFTFDGKKYFKLENAGIYRDWCSHSLAIVGTILIDGTNLHNYYNCFEFESNMVKFFKLGDDLLLVSGRRVLTITKYYPNLHGKIELALKLLDGRIMEPQIFEKRANHPHKLIYYNVGSSGLQIYHNQPVDEHHIGFVDLKNKSIKDFDMKMEHGGLLLSYNNSTLVRIEDWDNYQPTRKMLFAFDDRFLANAECILSGCDPDDIIEEFKVEKKKKRSTKSAKNKTSRGSSWINDFVNVIINPIRNLYSTLFHHNFLDSKFPLPKPRSITMVENLASIINLTENYKRVLVPQGSYNSFQLYSDIAVLLRNERYDKIQNLLENFK